MKIASFFSGAGGLDLGFTNAGFKVVFANDNWSGCWETYEKNHHIEINKKSIVNLSPKDIPEVIGFIGGPPCQSWSLAGSMRGIEDPRGKLFYTYINLIKSKKPLFFLAENVAGMLSSKHYADFMKIIYEFENTGYVVTYKLLDSKDYLVPQERKRIIIVGYHKSLNKKFEFPTPFTTFLTLRDAIGDLHRSFPNFSYTSKIKNHEYLLGDFSSLYMSRNRVRSWNEPSFTIQAGARHAPIHPQAPKMVSLEPNKRCFVEGKEYLYKRLSVRECARIQTFPDDFIFFYKNISDGYKQVGNAVPVKLAEILATKIKQDLLDLNLF